jgi:hypothetical protein
VNKTVSVLLASLLMTAPALAQTAAATTSSHAEAKAGQMLNDVDGRRLAQVDQVDGDGSAEIIIDGHVATIPATTLSVVNGHLMTSLKKTQIIAMQ